MGSVDQGCDGLILLLLLNLLNLRWNCELIGVHLEQQHRSCIERLLDWIGFILALAVCHINER